MRFVDEVRGDLASMAVLKRTSFPSLQGLVDIALLPGTWAVIFFRMSSHLHARGRVTPARLLRSMNSMLFGCDLSPHAEIGPGLALAHPVGVSLAAVRAGRNLRLMGGVRLGGPSYERPDEPVWVNIGDDCWVFDGANVIGSVNVGDNSVIGTNAVVRGNLTDGAVVVGDPARVVRLRERDEEIASI